MFYDSSIHLKFKRMARPIHDHEGQKGGISGKTLDGRGREGVFQSAGHILDLDLGGSYTAV